MRSKKLVPSARLCILVFLHVIAAQAIAQSTVCSVVRIEIQQELTLERQAFDAHMRITNGLDVTALEDIHINVWFRDADDNPVLASSDPDNTDASFFIVLDTMSGVTGIDGNGTIDPGAQADINWLIIPAPGTGGQTSGGMLYQVGATLSYTFGGESETVEVAPDFIQVRPMPRLALDYFLPDEVIADDPLTPEEEESEPFELGVRVTNSGFGSARNLAIESAQPEIVDNQQGLPIQFELLDTQVDDQPVVNSLLADFGDLGAGSAAMAVWRMTTSLYGHFISFEADYYHSDELGGEMTSLIERVETHTLLRSVRNDLPGRDAIRDFLARDGDVLRLYESDGADTLVTDISSSSSLELIDTETGYEYYRLEFPSTNGPIYTVMTDPTDGEGSVSAVWRSDGKKIPSVNFWQFPSKESGDWKNELHVFDTNSSGQYEIVFEVEVIPNKPPELSPVNDQEITAGDVLELTISATDPEDDVLTFALDPLPAGASFDSSGNDQANLIWATDDSDVGTHDLTVTVSDGEYEVSEQFSTTVLENPIGSIIIEADLPIETMNDGSRDSFEIKLDKAPDADVWIPLASSDDTRGTVEVGGVGFTASDWDTPQTVRVSGGVNDSGEFVGDLDYEILIGPSESEDENFQDLSHSPLPAVNRDTEDATIIVSPVTGLATAGEGTIARFELLLNGRPESPVSIDLESSHPDLGTPEPSTIVVNPESWNEPMEAEIRGQAVDDLEAGEVLYLIDAINVASSDERFVGANMDAIEVVHRGGETWGIEAGTVELPLLDEQSDWVQVEFDQPFRIAPVVVWLADDGEPDPAAVRIRNVTAQGFEAVQVEPPAVHGLTEATAMHYLAIEPGVHPLPEGGFVEAGLVATDRVQTGAGFGGPPQSSWERVDFEAGFDLAPALLAGIQSLANEEGTLPQEASRPWLTVAVEDVESSGASMALERSRVTSGDVQVPETIGYLAISAGEARFATNIGWAEWSGQEISEPAGPWRDGCEPNIWFAQAPSEAVLMAHQISRVNRQGGGWLRLCKDGDGFSGLLIDQDVERTPVRGIHAEDARALWFSRPFHTRLPATGAD